MRAGRGAGGDWEQAGGSASIRPLCPFAHIQLRFCVTQLTEEVPLRPCPKELLCPFLPTLSLCPLLATSPWASRPTRHHTSSLAFPRLCTPSLKNRMYSENAMQIGSTFLPELAS